MSPLCRWGVVIHDAILLCASSDGAPVSPSQLSTLTGAAALGQFSCAVAPCCAVPSHLVTRHTVPSRTVPCRAVPCLAVPYRTVPYRTVPYSAVPCLLPRRTVYRAEPSRTLCRAVPYHTVPCGTLPSRTMPCHVYGGRPGRCGASCLPDTP